MSLSLRLWSCTARCQDRSEREVVGIYRGDTCLFVSRSWCCPCSVPLLQASLSANAYALVAALLSVADYHVVDGVWFGEIAADWPSLAAISGLGRNQITIVIRELVKAGFVHYAPAVSRIGTGLLRIFPLAETTGQRLFSVDPSWLRGFIVTVEPRELVSEALVESKTVKFKSLAPTRPQARMAQTVREAPILIPVAALPIISRPVFRDGHEWLPGNLDIINKIKEAGIREDDVAIILGQDPELKFEGRKLTVPDSGMAVDKEGAAIWRQAWSQGGIEIRPEDQTALPAPTDLGVVPSWAVAGSTPQDQGGAAQDQNLVGSAPQAQDGGVQPTVENPGRSDSATGGDQQIRPSRDSGTTGQQGTRELSGPMGNIVLCSGSIPNGGMAPGVRACGAPAAPPPGAPPAASARYVRPRSERQLQPRQVDGLYQLRGPRVPDRARLAMTAAQTSCIETYERLAGLPFCQTDLVWLEKALTLTSLECVLRGIKGQCLTYPPENPGAYVFRDGMAHIYRAIEGSKFLRAKARGGKDAKAKAGSALTDKVHTKIMDRKRRRADAVLGPAATVSPKAPIVSAPAPIVSAQGPVVPPTEPVVSSEPSSKKGSVWPT